MQERWLLVTVATAESPSTLRIDAWRSLRALGAHYLQRSVCLLPLRPVTTEALGRLTSRVERQGGHARVFDIGRLDEVSERATVSAFTAERTDEYTEVVSSTRAFLDDIAVERDHGRTTYPELEASDADLRRLQQWLASIRRRDWFDASAYAGALAAVEECERALAELEAAAFAAELSTTRDEAAAAPWRQRLGVFAQASRN